MRKKLRTSTHRCIRKRKMSLLSRVQRGSEKRPFLEKKNIYTKFMIRYVGFSRSNDSKPFSHIRMHPPNKGTLRTSRVFLLYTVELFNKSNILKLSSPFLIRKGTQNVASATARASVFLQYAAIQKFSAIIANKRGFHAPTSPRFDCHSQI